MGWWPFSGNSPTNQKYKSEFDEFVPPPPGGSPFAEPPSPPKGINNIKELSETPFTGFSEPPPTTSPGYVSTSDKAAASNSFPHIPFTVSPKSNEYDANELQKFSPQFNETSGLNDEKYIRMNNATTWADRTFTSPRARNCFESIKMGLTMGSAVGGIFGGLTGVYASIVHRNLLILPLSVAGGALSFGFFLGCGMIVRCEEAVKPQKYIN